MSEITGHCYCGAIRYRSRGSPKQVDTCYCSDCARVVGSPVTVWVKFASGDFAFTSGEPVEFESSPGVLRTFCGRCGSALTYHYPDRQQVDVTTSTLDDPDAFPPTTDGPGRPTWLARPLPRRDLGE